MVLTRWRRRERGTPSPIFMVKTPDVHYFIFAESCCKLGKLQEERLDNHVALLTVRLPGRREYREPRQNGYDGMATWKNSLRLKR
jgi:hypothetical protein